MSEYRVYDTRTFSEIFDDFLTFKGDYDGCGLPKTIRETDPVLPTDKSNSLKTLYFLLLGKYGFSHIATMNEERFKLRLMSIIFESGKTWEKKLDLHDELCTLTIDNISKSQTIMNSAYNPETAPATTSETGIDYTNSQNVTHSLRSKGEGFAQYITLLGESEYITEDFLMKFNELFTAFPPMANMEFLTSVEED